MNAGAFRVRAVLTDIEGTTTTIAFVHDVLFPYADEHLDGFVARHREDAEIAAALRDAAREAGVGEDDEPAILAALHGWIAEDKKITPLKTIQGRIWQEGYDSTGLRGHLYRDVEPVLQDWHRAGLGLYVYSSGSIAAQRTLFGHSDAGDLTPLFSGYFDTTIGPKTVAQSYRRIAVEIGLAPGAVLFLSDNERELDAAREAGMQTARLLRPADTPPGATTTHPAYVTFDELARDVVPA